MPEWDAAGPHIQRLRIRNYRVLRDVTLDDIAPITALIGANGSGKSTLFDALSFVQDAVVSGLADPWERRGGLAEIRSRDAAGPVQIELGCRLGDERFDYSLAVDEEEGVPVVAAEQLTWHSAERSEVLLRFTRGNGVILDDAIALAGADTLGLSVIGQLKEH